MTPYQLRILLHVNSCPGSFEHDDTDLYGVTISDFMIDGVMTTCADSEIEHGLALTNLGRAWVKSILHTDIPKVCYIDCCGEEIPLDDE